MADTEKREAQKKNREQAMKKAKLVNSIKWVVIGIVGLALVTVIAWLIINNAILNTKPVDNYSAGLNDDGTITDVRALDYVELCDYKNIVLDPSEVEISEETLQDHIDRVLAAFPEKITDSSVVVKDGDQINIDFLGTLDGVPFDGGSTNGAGSDITLGSGQFIEGFEAQIVGHKVGETFDIFVTFPEQYTAELAGKDAVFSITINCLYKEATVFDDDFVAANLSDIAITKEGYINSIKQRYRDAAMSALAENYVVENSKVKSYPKKYINILKGLMKNEDQKEYETAVLQYQSNGTVAPFASLEDYVGLSKKEYEASLSTEAMKQADSILIIQAICEDAGLTVSSDDITEVLESNGLNAEYYDRYEKTYGVGYMKQTAMYYTVLHYLEGCVSVSEE